MIEQQNIWKDLTRHFKQRLNNTTKGKTKQHNTKKDSNRLEKLKTQQFKKTPKNLNGSSSSKGFIMDQIS